MRLQAGTRLGAYEIVGPIGAGGMGEVYRARDARMQRDVAVKILPEHFASDPERLARFDREARMLAALNHPNIAHIFCVEEGALVIEYVDGEDLSARLARGPVPIAETLKIAGQVAAALEAAHEAGIIHRDLKPANIKIRPDGRVKVLDFGLAREEHGATPRITTGVVVGTAAYMAPEQAKGRAIDRRVDVWAFGCVLFEMLTGRRAFPGKAIGDVIAAVLNASPALDTLPPETPFAVRQLLRRCFEKEPSKRLDSMAAARIEIEDAAAWPIPPELQSMTMIVPVQRFDRRFAIAAALMVITIAAMGTTLWWRTRGARPGTATRLAITTRDGAPFAHHAEQPDIAVLPDESGVAIWTRAGGGARYLVRPLNSFDERALLGIDPAGRGLAVSADSRWIAYVSGGYEGQPLSLVRAPIAGGSTATVTPLDGELRGASWGRDDGIVYATANPQTGLFRVGDGSAAQQLTAPNAAQGEVDHVWPHAVPGGRFVLFTIRRAAGGSDIALLDLPARTWRVLVRDGSYPRYAASGHIVYGARGSLHAVRFDQDTGQVSGAPVLALEGVTAKPSGAVNFDLSEQGTLVYMAGSSEAFFDPLRTSPAYRVILNWLPELKGLVER